MAQPHGTTVPDGLEPVPHDRLPEFVPPYNEKQVSPHQESSPAAVGTATGGKTIFGLRRPTFFLVLLLILVIIIAAVAGGVGGSVAVNNAYDRGKADAAAEGLTDGESSTIGDGTEDNDEDSDKPTETSSSRVQPPPTEGVLALDCPDLTDTTKSLRIGAKTYKFHITCGINHSAPNGAEDIMTLPAYSLDDCMRACASFNDMDVFDKTCVTAHFNAHILSTPSGNCWLKSKVGKSTRNKNDKTKNLQVEAELLDD